MTLSIPTDCHSAEGAGGTKAGPAAQVPARPTSVIASPVGPITNGRKGSPGPVWPPFAALLVEPGGRPDREAQVLVVAVWLDEAIELDRRARLGAQEDSHGERVAGGGGACR